jgi:hypothetical protein
MSAPDKQEDLISMAKAAASSARAPRGTRVLTQAFFSAAEEIPEGQRDAVVKAAFALIRDTLKETREKTKAAKAKAKAGGPARGRTAEPARATRTSAAKGRKAGTARRGRPPAQAAAETSDEAAG